MSSPSDVIRPSTTKNVYFYKSGDDTFQGVKIPITKHNYHTLDALLDDLNTKVPGLTRGVRRIYTAQGKDPINDISELKKHGRYVCTDKQAAGSVPGIDLSKLDYFRSRGDFVVGKGAAWHELDRTRSISPTKTTSAPNSENGFKSKAAKNYSHLSKSTSNLAPIPDAKTNQPPKARAPLYQSKQSVEPKAKAESRVSKLVKSEPAKVHETLAAKKPPSGGKSKSFDAATMQPTLPAKLEPVHIENGKKKPKKVTKISKANHEEKAKASEAKPPAAPSREGSSPADLVRERQKLQTPKPRLPTSQSVQLERLIDYEYQDNQGDDPHFLGKTIPDGERQHAPLERSVSQTAEAQRKHSADGRHSAMSKVPESRKHSAGSQHSTDGDHPHMSPGNSAEHHHPESHHDETPPKTPAKPKTPEHRPKTSEKPKTPAHEERVKTPGLHDEHPPKTAEKPKTPTQMNHDHHDGSGEEHTPPSSQSDVAASRRLRPISVDPALANSHQERPKSVEKKEVHAEHIDVKAVEEHHEQPKAVLPQPAAAPKVVAVPAAKKPAQRDVRPRSKGAISIVLDKIF